MSLCSGVARLRAFFSFFPLEQNQAQLFIHIYPSQDNPTNQTLWIFSGSSTAFSGGTQIRTSSDSNNYGAGEGSWEFAENFYDANKPSDVNFQLSPLFSSSNTNDIESVRTRTAGVWGAGSPFANNATNTPTITIGSGSRTISHLFMDEDSGQEDDLGIRVSGSSLSYSTGNSSAWVGSGIINKPIGDFFAGTFNRNFGGRFAANSEGSIRLVVNSQVIPEPEEYALVFALFALGFVFFHRRQMQKKKPQRALA